MAGPGEREKTARSQADGAADAAPSLEKKPDDVHEFSASATWSGATKRFPACSRTDPGISREKAEAILRAFDFTDFTDIELQPSPEGWSGTAVPASGGYRIRATVDRQGVMQLQP